MLLVPLYHRIDSRIRHHLTYFSTYTHIVLPGDPLHPNIPNLCLTFDDATEDFYQVVFPLLQELNLRALLAVPAGFIGLSGYCTWDNLQEMVQSKRVEIASHSLHHPNLLLTEDLDCEIFDSKQLLEERLPCSVRTFVYPFGKFNHAIHQRVRAHYEFVMRIGSTWNRSWQNHSGLIYRIPCTPLTPPDSLFSLKRKLTYFCSYCLNSLRRR